MKKAIIAVPVAVMILAAAILFLMPKREQGARTDYTAKETLALLSPTPMETDEVSIAEQQQNAIPTPTLEITPAPTAKPTPTPVPSLPPATEPEVDVSETDKAVLLVRYQSDKKIKVRISKKGTTYTYDLTANNLPTRYPLNMGPGQYTVEVLENVGGTSYRSLMKESFSASWDDPYTPYLQSVQNMRWDVSMVPILDALDMAVKAGDSGKTAAIYEELSGTLVYDYEVYENKSLPAGYLPEIERTYETRKGICFDMSSLLAGMLRSVGVPVKLMMGYSELIQGYHAWNEVLVGGEWVLVDLTVDSIYREAEKEYSFSKDFGQYFSDKEY